MVQQKSEEIAGTAMFVGNHVALKQARGTHANNVAATHAGHSFTFSLGFAHLHSCWLIDVEVHPRPQWRGRKLRRMKAPKLRRILGPSLRTRRRTTPRVHTRPGTVRTYDQRGSRPAQPRSSARPNSGTRSVSANGPHCR